MGLHVGQTLHPPGAPTFYRIMRVSCSGKTVTVVRVHPHPTSDGWVPTARPAGRPNGIQLRVTPGADVVQVGEAMLVPYRGPVKTKGSV